MKNKSVFSDRRMLIPLLILVLTAGCGRTEFSGKTTAEILNRTAEETEKETMRETVKETMEETETAEEAVKEKETAGKAAKETPGGTLKETAKETVPETTAPDPDTAFYMTEITDDIFARMEGRSYRKDCTTERSSLAYVHILHKDAEGNVKEGEIVCSRKIAGDLLDIFRTLYDKNYPIEKVCLVDDYEGDDEASMADNNSSCFNFRTVPGKTKLSRHAYGRAIDINPLYNPYIHMRNGEKVIEPENGAMYADRSRDFPYKITEGDLCWRLFTEHGFTWGGSWNSSKDYQHFQK